MPKIAETDRYLFVDDPVPVDRALSRGQGDASFRRLMRAAEDKGCTAADPESETRHSGVHSFRFRHGFAIDRYRFGPRSGDATKSSG